MDFQTYTVDERVLNVLHQHTPLIDYVGTYACSCGWRGNYSHEKHIVGFLRETGLLRSNKEFRKFWKKKSL